MIFSFVDFDSKYMRGNIPFNYQCILNLNMKLFKITHDLGVSWPISCIGILWWIYWFLFDRFPSLSNFFLRFYETYWKQKKNKSESELHVRSFSKNNWWFEFEPVKILYSWVSSFVPQNLGAASLNHCQWFSVSIVIRYWNQVRAILHWLYAYDSIPPNDISSIVLWYNLVFYHSMIFIMIKECMICIRCFSSNWT